MPVLKPALQNLFQFINVKTFITDFFFLSQLCHCLPHLLCKRSNPFPYIRMVRLTGTFSLFLVYCIRFEQQFYLQSAVHLHLLSLSDVLFKLKKCIYDDKYLSPLHLSHYQTGCTAAALGLITISRGKGYLFQSLHRVIVCPGVRISSSILDLQQLSKNIHQKVLLWITPSASKCID